MHRRQNVLGNSFAGRRRAYSRRASRRVTDILDFEDFTTPVQEKKQMASGLTAELKRGASIYMREPEKIVVRGVDTPESDVSPIQLQRLKLPLNEATVVSMMHVGVQKTIFCRRNGDQLEVWDGNRRVLHAREANRRLLAAGREPILVKLEITKASDEQIFALSRLNNRHHVDESPLQTAEAAAIMLNKMDEEQAAAYLGVGVPMLRIYLSLNDLDPIVRDGVADGQISLTAASKLARLPREEQVTSFKAALAEGGGGKVTVAAAAAVRATAQAKKANGKKAKEIAPAPPKRVLTKLVSAVEEKELEVPGAENLSFYDGIKFALGQLPPQRVKGMTAAITQLTAKKRRSAEA